MGNPFLSPKTKTYLCDTPKSFENSERTSQILSVIHYPIYIVNYPLYENHPCPFCSFSDAC
jgi:hypothetical protein